MATRSFIILSNPNGKHCGIYCHNDGSPMGVGKILTSFYKDVNKIQDLIDLGDISSLDKTLDGTIAYARDRGENINKTKAKYFTDLIEAIKYGWENAGADYVYVFRPKDKKWETHQVGKGDI